MSREIAIESGEEAEKVEITEDILQRTQDAVRSSKPMKLRAAEEYYMHTRSSRVFACRRPDLYGAIVKENPTAGQLVID